MQTHLSVRPEDVRLGHANGAAGLSGEIAFVRDIGASIEAHVTCGDARIICVANPREVDRCRGGETR